MSIVGPLKGKIAFIGYSAIVALSIIIVLWGIRFTLMEGHEDMKETVVKNIGSMQTSFKESAATVMRDAGQEIIRLKAQKVAKEIENYLILHPQATVKSLQNVPEFKLIAIQPIGKTGYTAVHEAKTSINRFHVNPKIVNTNLDVLARDFPDFWKIITASKNDKNVGGYYNWPEADGRVREKYMWITLVSRPTADGVLLDVAATTYIDEFMIPFDRLTEKLKRDSAATSSKISSLSQRIQYRTFLANMAIILIFCCILGYLFFRLSKDYRRIKLEINKRETIEATLRHSEHRLKELIDFLPDPTFAIDGDKRVTVWNRAMEKMTGVPSSQMIGEGDYGYTVPFYGERRPLLMDLLWEPDSELENTYATVRKEGNNLTAETFCPALYGGIGAYVYAIASPLRDLDGNIIGAIEAVRDITERKQIEESIREAKNKTDAILGASPNAIITINEKGMVDTFNPAAEQIFGYESDEITGQNISLLMSEEHGDKHDTYLDNYLKTGLKKVIGKRLEVTAKRKNGELFPIEIGISEVTLKDAKFFTAIIMDITERKKAEEKLRQRTEDLEKFMKLTIDRELKMIALKKEINACLKQAGMEEKYPIEE